MSDTTTWGAAPLLHPASVESGQVVAQRQQQQHGSKLERPVGISVLQAAFFQLAIILGLGALGLSFAFASMGWVLAIIMLATSAGGALYSGIWITKIVLHITGLPGAAAPRKYSELGEAAFGSLGRIVVQNVQYSFLGGAMVAVQLTASKALVQVVAAAGGHLCLWTSNLVIAIAMLPVMQVQELRDVSWTAFVGVLSILVPVVLFLDVVADSTAGTTPGQPATLGFPPSSGFNAFANGLTTIVFSYQGQTIFPEIIGQMRRPAKFSQSVVAATVFMTLFYLIVGCFGYAKLGGGATYLVDYVDKLQNKDSTKIAIANTLLMINVMMGYTINGNIMNKALYDRWLSITASAAAASGRSGAGGGQASMRHRRAGGGSSAVPAAATHDDDDGAAQPAPRVAWFCVTLVSVGVSFLLSNLLPSLGNLLSVLGATCGYALTFLFPALFALRLMGPRMGTCTRVLHAAVVLLACIAVVLGSYATIKNLIHGIEGNVRGGLFSC